MVEGIRGELFMKARLLSNITGCPKRVCIYGQSAQEILEYIKANVMVMYLL